MTDLRITQAAIEVAITRIPSSSVYREHIHFLWFNAGGTDYAWGTKVERRHGLWFTDRLEWLTPSDSFRDDFGFQSTDRITAEIADPDNDFVGLVGSLRGVEATLELLTRRVTVDGNTAEVWYRRQVTIDHAVKVAGGLRLELVDFDTELLEGTYPNDFYTATDWPEIFLDDEGLAVPDVIGTVLKVPFAYVEHNSGAGPWVYAGPKTTGSPSILTVYRAGRIVDPSEYSVGSQVAGSITFVTLTFTAEQVDFAGNQEPITADMSGGLSRNAATELVRIMGLAGISPGSMGGATQYATDNLMLIDVAYLTPRTYRAIILDLLLLLRGHLYRTAAGDWDMIQDRPVDVLFSLDEEQHDMVEVTEYSKPRRVRTFEVEYKNKDSRNLFDLRHVITRTTSGATGTERYTLPYVRDHETADRLLSYLRYREESIARAKATIYDVQIPIGSRIRLDSDYVFSGQKDFLVLGVRHLEDRNELDLREYDETIYTYVAGTLPTDATTGYQPDYSKTPPLAPTGLTVVTNGIVRNEDGVVTAYAEVKATPPVLNWSTMFFSITNAVTGEVYKQEGDDIGGGEYGTTIYGLRPGISHNLTSWARNEFGLDGAAAATVNFTSAGWTTTPAAPASINATAGLGKIIYVAWGNVSISNLSYYELQRNGSALSNRKTTTYADANVAYGVSYTYRVRAVDKSGNVSAWTTATPISLSRNIDEPDLLPDSVGPDQIQTGAVSANAQGNAGSVFITTSGGSWQNVVNVALTTVGGDVLISLSAQVNATVFNGWRPWVDIRIRRNSTMISQRFDVWSILNSSGGTTQQYFMLSYAFIDNNPTAGTHTYRLDMREDSGLGVNTWCTASVIQVIEYRDT